MVRGFQWIAVIQSLLDDLGLTGEWAAKPIAMYGRNSVSGTYECFREAFLNSGDYKADVKQQPGSEAVVQAVAADKCAIGYSGIGYKTADVRAVPLSVRPGGPCYGVSAEETYSGKYPNRALSIHIFEYI